MQEFKKFALRGNVIDMAVGIIIGGAFGTVVKSLVDDVIMPPIGYVTSGVDFKKSGDRECDSRIANGGNGAQAGDHAQLRRVHQQRDYVSDRRLGRVHARQGDERGRDAIAARRAAAGGCAAAAGRYRCCCARFAMS